MGARGVDLPLVLETMLAWLFLANGHSGRPQNSDDVVMMTLGTGIGTAAVMEGAWCGASISKRDVSGTFHYRCRRPACVRAARAGLEAEASTYALPDMCRTWRGFETSPLGMRRSSTFAALFRCGTRR